ncbi:glycine zipper 2TM domain-containing protein [Massilia sp. 9096]|uniref:glycine zipper 2TM domain-containing protein n=1 Tax=Massilia sp. 9096 TaxID=1500894 RepID=UPI0009E01876|nr:glycine zipper 2TM domain-containing protein [Massilia sp. 9096]
MAKSRHTLAAAMVAALPLLSVTVPATVQAQDHPRAARLEPHITGFNVDEVRALGPGTELNFELYGTPGGYASLRIDGATRNLNLTETSPGTYQGTYTVGPHDRLDPGSRVTANLRLNNMTDTKLLAESIVRGAPNYDSRVGNVATVPHVDRFDVRGSDDLGPGNQLNFTVMGTPGAKVDVKIAGTQGVFFLPEVQPGQYSGLYTIRRDDRIAPDAPVTATIRANGRLSTALLGRPLLAGGPRMDRPRDDGPGSDRRRGDQQVARYCTNCATVEAVNAIESSGNGGALATGAGAVVGGLLGNQVGSGNGRTAATVAGALGGAIAGREIERNRNGGQRYDVVVRFSDGSTQTMRYDNDPGFRVGEQVKVNDGVLARD